MIDSTAINAIEERLEAFVNGEPQSFEIYVAEGVWFRLDCPFEEDLLEGMIPVTVGIKKWSPHYIGLPPSYMMLDDYGKLGDELASELDGAIHSATDHEEAIFEYDASNSCGSMIMFTSMISNPRAKFDLETNTVVTNPKYA